MSGQNRQIHIVELPKDKLGPEHFRLAQGPMPHAKDGEVLLKTKLISLDAANRAILDDDALDGGFRLEPRAEPSGVRDV